MWVVANVDAAVADTAREQRIADEIVPQVVVGDAVWLSTPRHPRVLALFAEPTQATRRAVIVVHGLGVNPDWNLVGALRMQLADAGFATLSVQMPVLAADAPKSNYIELYPDAGERLDAAVSWLRARGYARIAVVSHSMGAAMVNAWLSQAPPRSIDAWVPVGLLVGFAVPPRQPVLDVVAEHDFPDALMNARTREAQLPRDGCSAASTVASADHYFEDAVPRLVGSIVPFLTRVLAGKCVPRK